MLKVAGSALRLQPATGSFFKPLDPANKGDI